MTLSLRGRFETRLFLLLFIGVPWSAALMTVHRPGDATFWHAQLSSVAVLAFMALLGLGWECLYHALQQLRWDRDWPSLLSLLACVLEAGPLWLVVGALPGPVDRGSAASFGVLVGSTWFVMWAFAQGPMRVVFIRWRLTGGRVLCSR